MSGCERDDVGGYSTRSPDLPGCVAAAGATRSAFASMTEAMSLHLAGMRGAGEPVPEPTALAALVVPATPVSLNPVAEVHRLDRLTSGLRVTSEL